MGEFDPFAVLGLPWRYDVDAGEIERRYLERSAGLHPDVMGEGSWSELGGDPGESDGFSELNRARQVLEDPEQRAVALWRLLGGANGGAVGGSGADDKSLPPAFLMEMMEVREEIDAARASKDAASIARWEAWAESQRAEYQKRVGELFARIDPVKPDPSALKQIKTQLNAWRYIERLVEQLH